MDQMHPDRGGSLDGNLEGGADAAAAMGADPVVEEDRRA
jgi:hypothetical protein